MDNSTGSSELPRGGFARQGVEVCTDSLIWNELLMGIANWELSAFFVALDGQVIIAPYDGGVDVILKDEPTRDACREKYRDWLSAHESGL